MVVSRTSNTPLWHQSPNAFMDPMSSFMHTPQQEGQSEDWEDWLKWEPTAEPTSPEDDSMNSASSKHDSPLQDHVLPMTLGAGNKDLGHDDFPPPIIVGDYPTTMQGPLGELDMAEDMYLFGQASVTASDFSFDRMDMFEPAQPSLGAQSAPGDITAWLPTTGTSSTNESLLVPLTHQPISTQSSHSHTTVVSTPAWQHDSPKSRSQDRNSPSTQNSSPSQESQPPAKKRPGRKRKVDSDREKEERDQDSDPAIDGDEPPIKKTSHNVIEKRYRNNLNDKIVELRNSVPSLRALGRANGGKDSEDLEGLTPAHKLNKATVMGKATEYIRHLEKRNKTMTDEMTALKARLAAAEATISKNAEVYSAQRSSAILRQPSICSQTANSVLPVMTQEQMQFGHALMPQALNSNHVPPMYTAPPTTTMPTPGTVRSKGKRSSGSVMNKVMMGAMAGLMVMEGFSEQQDDKRALFALPIEVIRGIFVTNSLASTTLASRYSMIAMLKIMFVLGVLIHLISPLLQPRPRQQKKVNLTVRLPHAPSLASPVEVRRNAWLTAVQTVYVRKHFLLEVVSVTSKMALLSVRRMIGSEAYCSLTGTNKEEEAARVKAWDIAINAQLAGGDAEISYYRLLLTLMVSGTLPDSPTRLMQKAVHFRVFFWEVANAGYGNVFGFRRFTERVGQFYWDAARKLQRENLQRASRDLPADKDETDELLPEHLASLLEIDCEEVLNSEMIQRAWNLAWNKPSAFATTSNGARDAVVEDHAIHSPLDAVAAWYANMAVDEALLDTLGDHPSTWDADFCIGVAVSVAPPASATQGRALAAKAVMSNMNRTANIVAALDALHLDTRPRGSVNFVNYAPASPDVCTALTLAKLLTLVEPKSQGTARIRGQEMLACMRIPPSSFTLLSAVALYRLLKLFIGDYRLSPVAMYNIEDMAASLRIWIGTSTGRKSGLADHDVACAKLVDACLDVARKIGGWDERDSGYGSHEGSPTRSRATTALLR